MPDILARVSNFIQHSGMPLAPQKVLVALSGGADSVALLLILKGLGYEVHAAHCNFCLRPESANEEVWVQQLCQHWDINLTTIRFSAADFAKFEGEGTQQAARKLRYAFFEAQLAKLEISHCATGHHADDQVESLIMSFFRGNGPRLFHPIPAQRGAFWRPLLEIPKSELTQWLIERGQSWCHDMSNDSHDYQRNVVRNQLLPLLEQIQPAFRARFQHQAARYTQQQAWMSHMFAPMTDKIVRVIMDRYYLQLDQCRQILGAEFATLYIEWWLEGKSFAGNQIAEVLRLMTSESGASIRSGEWEVLKDRDQLIFRHRATPLELEPKEIQPQLNRVGEMIFGKSLLNHVVLPAPIDLRQDPMLQEQHALDLDCIEGPIYIRKWEQGDRMQPLGMNGTKLISDILINQKRDRFAKSTAWVLCDAHGILLLAGYRISQRVAITSSTKRVLRIGIRQSV